MRRISRHNVQYVAAAASVALAAGAAFADVWVFKTDSYLRQADDPSLWRLIFADHSTLGFVRLGLILLAVYVIASIPALVAGGRWIRVFGATGLTADEADESADTIEALRQLVQDTKRERDQALEMLERILG